MADEFVVFGRSSCGQAGDPRIDPSDSIRDVRTVNWNFMADEEIFCDIFFDPSGEIRFLLCRPTPFFHFPNLMGRFFNRFTESRYGRKEEQKKNQHLHKIILKRLMKDCQQGQNIQNLLIDGQSLSVQLI
jgi:hypothetical protein